MTGDAAFLYGTLCHPELLAVVLGRPASLHPAWLEDHAVHWVEAENFPIILARAGARAEGVVIEGLSAEDLARLDFYECGFRYRRAEVTVGMAAADAAGQGATRQAFVYMPEPGAFAPGAPWDLAQWAARFGPALIAAARGYMALFGRLEPVQAAAAYPSILADAVARIRAEATSAVAGDFDHAAVDIIDQRDLYRGFFALGEYRLRHSRFDGALSPEMSRLVFRSGEVVTMLPYDPGRDLVAMVEQFRMGPYARGDHRPWTLEAIAGRLDPGESPDEAARREAREEAGLELGRVWSVGHYYSSPGAMSEYVTSFVGVADLGAGGGRLGGKPAEGEDIRLHILPLAEAFARLDRGLVNTAPLLASLAWLRHHRGRLRAQWRRAQRRAGEGFGPA